MINSVPPTPFKPGDVLDADELSQIAESSWRGAQMTGAGMGGIVRPPGSAPILQIDPIPRVFARITGQGSGCAYSGSGGVPYPPALNLVGRNCYCGIEQISYSDGTLSDNEAGLVWDSFSFPLVEMTGNPDVPIDAIVWASPSRMGTHWEFLWMGETQSGGLPTPCTCCCCCVPCSGPIWLTIDPFFLDGCGLPAMASGIGPVCLRPDGSCYTGSGTIPDMFGTSPSTTTWTAMVCCDPNDKRKCPVLKLTGRLSVPSGEFAGTYDFCIGPLDFAVDGASQTEVILNCKQADPTYGSGDPGPQPPRNWSATIPLDTWNCDPNSNACQCPVVADAGSQIRIECLCQACPITGIPTSLPITIQMGHDFGCGAATGNINTSFTLAYFDSVPDSGSACTSAGDLGQPCWYGESADLGDGCKLGFLLLCRPASTGQLFALELCTIQIGEGDCTVLNGILTICWNAVGQTSTVCCDPFGIVIKNGGGFAYVTIGNPTCA